MMEQENPSSTNQDAIEILECNWPILFVWSRCSPTITMSGTCGVEAREVEAVARACDLKFTIDLLDDVRIMAAAADKVRNGREQGHT